MGLYEENTCEMMKRLKMIRIMNFQIVYIFAKANRRMAPSDIGFSAERMWCSPTSETSFVRFY